MGHAEFSAAADLYAHQGFCEEFGNCSFVYPRLSSADIDVGLEFTEKREGLAYAVETFHLLLSTWHSCVLGFGWLG